MIKSLRGFAGQKPTMLPSGSARWTLRKPDATLPIFIKMKPETTSSSQRDTFPSVQEETIPEALQAPPKEPLVWQPATSGILPEMSVDKLANIRMTLLPNLPRTQG